MPGPSLAGMQRHKRRRCLTPLGELIRDEGDLEAKPAPASVAISVRNLSVDYHGIVAAPRRVSLQVSALAALRWVGEERRAKSTLVQGVLSVLCTPQG